MLACSLACLALLGRLSPAFPAEREEQAGQIERGRPFGPLDLLGNILSLPKKLLLLNAKVDNHRISPKTERAVEEFLAAHPEAMKGVKVRLNQWTPAGEFQRLVKNKQIPWYFRVFPGIPTTLYSSLTGRLLGGDHYNPYTNTVHLFSDDAAIALHEAGHAKDFAGQTQPGLYAVGRILPPVELHQEATASDIAIEHFKETNDREGELHAYGTLYPAFGTYGGQHLGTSYGSYIGAGAGHLLGFWQRRERRLGYEALDAARVGDSPAGPPGPLPQALLRQNEETRSLLLESF